MHPRAEEFVAEADRRHGITPDVESFDEGTKTAADAVRMATPEEASEATGWSIGGVPPICHETDVPVLFDETLLECDTVWVAAGTPDSVWPVDP